MHFTRHCRKDNFSLGIFPNNFKKKDPKFTAVFYNLLPYNIDLYGVEFEGRKHQITKELETGHRRKELTSLSIPWVFKQSGNENRLLAFIGSSNLSFSNSHMGHGYLEAEKI